MDITDFWYGRVILGRAGGGYSSGGFFDDFRHDRYLSLWFSGLILVEALEADAASR